MPFFVREDIEFRPATPVTIQCLFTSAKEFDVSARPAIAIASFILFTLSACSDAPTDIDAGVLNTQPLPVREIVREAKARADNSRRDATAWGHYGHVLHANRLLPQAIEAYERASTIDPDDPEWLASRAVVLLRESRLEEAAVIASDALAAAGGKDPRLLFMAGSVYEELGRYDEAIAAYRSLTAISPASFEAQFTIGRVLLNLGRYEEALPHLQAAMAGAPQSAQIRSALVRLSTAAPDLEVPVPGEEMAVNPGAITMPLPYEEQLRPYVRMVDGLRITAADLLAMNMYAEAEQLLNLMQRYYPRQMLPQEWMDLAHLQAARGDISAAEASYRNCIDQHPEFANAHLGLADLLFMKNDLAGARASYRQADDLATTERQRARVLQGYGRLAARAGNLEESLNHMQSAADAWPESGLVQEDLARILADLGRFDEAWTHVNRAEGLGHKVNEQFKQQLRAVSSR